MPRCLYYILGLQDFHGIIKILFAVHLKHSSFWPSADVKHVHYLYGTAMFNCQQLLESTVLDRLIFNRTILCVCVCVCVCVNFKVLRHFCF
jgi:hypothetical protein